MTGRKQHALCNIQFLVVGQKMDKLILTRLAYLYYSSRFSTNRAKYLYVIAKSVFHNAENTKSVLLWCPIKVRVFHRNESCLSCPHPPLSYEGRREQKGSSHFDEKLSF